MKIVVDGFGGDNSPNEVVFGCLLALEEKKDLEISISGSETIIKKLFSEHNIDIPNRLTIINAEEVVENEDDPITAIKQKKDSSLVVGLNHVASGFGDAFVSAGNTGAVLTGATLIIKRIKGIKRAALAPTVPTRKGKAVIIDVGANAECKPEFLPQFAIMGAIYAKEILNQKTPKVGLINIGTEEHKGRGDIVQAYQLLKVEKNINFIGNVEARDILKGDADVLVADGWTGNIALKSIEGTASTLFYFLKEIFYKNAFTKLAALILKPGLNEFKKKFDHKEVGGALLLGLNTPVIKAHGNSDKIAFKNAILFASSCAEKKVCQIIQDAVNFDSTN